MALAAATLTVLVTTGPAPAREEQETVDRIAGRGRVETAATIAATAFPDGASTAVLARADAFPDALASAGYAGAVDAPVLLTASDTLSPRTATALDDLGVGEVTIVGGTSAVSDDVAADLRDDGYDVTRLAGQDRIATAAAVARGMRDRIGGIDGRGARVAMLAAAGTFADAIVAGPVANARRLPVLLTAGDGLHPTTADVIADLGIDHVVVTGGTAVVPVAVEDDLDDLGVSHERVAGRDRTDTAQAMATFASTVVGFDVTDVLVARGDAFPDALAAAPLAGRRADPLLLTRTPAVIGYDPLQWIVDRADEPGDEPQIDRIVALGGEAALAPDVLEHLGEAAAPPETVLTYSVQARGDVPADLAFFSEHVDWTLTDPRGWALGHDVRFDRVADPAAADLNVYLASPSKTGAAADGCSPDWSCQPAGTNDVYVNVDHWNDATTSYRQAGRSLDDYRHYVVLHEIGHAPPMNFGHLRCENTYENQAGEPAPVMEQQSIDRELGSCRTRVWPLQFERDTARDRILGEASTLGTGGEDRTYAP